VVDPVIGGARPVPCSAGLWPFAKRSIGVPAGTKCAAANRWGDADFKPAGVEMAFTVVSLSGQEAARSSAVSLREPVPYFTKPVEFAMAFQVTVPGIAILRALLRAARCDSVGRADA
jgi:hypothetical protein